MLVLVLVLCAIVSLLCFAWRAQRFVTMRSGEGKKAYLVLSLSYVLRCFGFLLFLFLGCSLAIIRPEIVGHTVQACRNHCLVIIMVVQHLS